MKRYYAAAGALLLGTSALAWAADMDTSAIEPTKTAIEAKTGMSWDKTVADASSLAAKSELLATGDSKIQSTTLDKNLQDFAKAEIESKFQTASFDAKGDAAWSDDSKLATAAFDSKSDLGWSDGDTKLQTASLDKGDAGLGDSKLQTASMDTKLDSAWTGDRLDTAWADTDGKIQTASVDKTETGMGGPLEELTPASGSIVAPSNADPERDARGIAVISDPAYVPPGYNGIGGAAGGPDEGPAESYPACTADVTDNCIQLYERGVHASGAAAQTSGTDESAGMGGPYEPVDNDSADLAMNGDGRVDLAMGETSDLAVQTADSAADAAVAGHADYQGVGGPVEAQSGYPPCSPGPGDDRCIQLYERGVTGAGN
jgi:hypothetical protein